MNGIAQNAMNSIWLMSQTSIAVIVDKRLIGAKMTIVKIDERKRVIDDT